MLWLLACEIHNLSLASMPQVGQVLRDGCLQNKLTEDEGMEYKHSDHLVNDRFGVFMLPS